MLTKRISVGALALLSVSALTLAPLTAADAAGTASASATASDYTPAELALAAHLGVTPAEARVTFDTQEELADTAEQLDASLAPTESAGSWIDGDQLVVAVTTEAAAAEVRAEGATPTLVENSEAELADTSETFAAAAGTAPGVASWGIDPVRNAVTVEVVAGADDPQTQAARAEAARLGAEVVEVDAAPRLTADIVGGEQFEFVSNADGQRYVCSVGFTARDAVGRNAIVTAGHCAAGQRDWTFKNGSLGTAIGASFPGDDFAAFRLAPSLTPRGVVRTAASTTPVRGSTEAPVGSAVCKSGRTTGWTCGVITATNRTVNYGQNEIVTGLVEHNACVEPGDSGGSNISGDQAQGVSSGGALYRRSVFSNQLVCGAKVGRPNQSYYQPVNEILQRYGLTLITG